MHTGQKFSTFVGIGIDANAKLIDSAIDYAARKLPAGNGVSKQAFYGKIYPELFALRFVQ